MLKINEHGSIVSYYNVISWLNYRLIMREQTGSSNWCDRQHIYVCKRIYKCVIYGWQASKCPSATSVARIGIGRSAFSTTTITEITTDETSACDSALCKESRCSRLLHAKTHCLLYYARLYICINAARHTHTNTKTQTAKIHRHTHPTCARADAR